ncbi:MAG: toll/interleukin-1 receptor domain-containing protein [Verrucomicrobia bacterium]|nr:toll/interleukin-1 receptor domain-containing protein [Verrucomicrobiota bacterium]
MSIYLKYDVFLSHSAKDKAVVRAVAERLRKDGLKVWFDEWELPVAASRQSAANSSEFQTTGEKDGGALPRRRYDELIEEGLEHSRVLVLCMSANAFGSDWAQLESGTFRFRDPLNKERRFIPLRLDDAPIKGSLAQFLYD